MTSRFSLASALGAALVSLTFAAGSAQAAVKPNPIFSNNAVLQQGETLNVWGTTDAADKITVALGETSVEAKIDGKKWKAELPPQKAGGPHKLTITQGGQKIELTNVLVGEVWICGGQSNMQWEVHQSADAEAVKASATDQIRLFTVARTGAPEPKDEVQGQWVIATPETVNVFSAVGYTFGFDVHKATGVPVGLISSNIGGTTAERWISPQAIKDNPSLDGMSHPQGIFDLYNAMIAPLSGYGVKGAIWYQGESNNGRGFQYRTLLKALVEDWRRNFHKKGEEFPFLIVQLAPFTKIKDQPGDSGWAEIREAQSHVAKTVPGAAVAVITELGEENDIHPQKKKEVGQRLALAAQALAYGKKIAYISPTFDHLAIEGDKAVVSFKHAEGGLEAKGDKLVGFTIAGEDKKFYHAEAKIDGDKVVVSSPNVPKPVAVRYGWADFPVVNLWGKSGLPADPFRSDDFPLTSQNAK